MEHREETGGVIIQAMLLPSTITLVYSGKTMWLVPRASESITPGATSKSFHRKSSSILIPWSITGLADLPLIPYRRSIDTKHSGYNLYVCKMGLVHHSDSSAVGVFPSQEVLLLQENFPTWTSESTVAMTTVCHNHCMHLIAVNQLVYTRAPWNVCFQHSLHADLDFNLECWLVK